MNGFLDDDECYGENKVEKMIWDYGRVILNEVGRVISIQNVIFE